VVRLALLDERRVCNSAVMSQRAAAACNLLALLLSLSFSSTALRVHN
jgi:hypothetical protein